MCFDTAKRSIWVENINYENLKIRIEDLEVVAGEFSSISRRKARMISSTTEEENDVVHDGLLNIETPYESNVLSVSKDLTQESDLKTIKSNLNKVLDAIFIILKNIYDICNVTPDISLTKINLKDEKKTIEAS